MRKGRNFLLAIGIDAYQHMGKLMNCVRDTKALIDILIAEYGFEEGQVITLFNDFASKENILEAFDQLSDKLTSEDNLVIYFAGHGYYKKNTKIGFLVPVDGKKGKNSSLIYNSVIRDYIRGIPAHHIFLLVDSCFSGDLIMRSRKEEDWNKATESYAEKVDHKSSRWGLAAGRIEEVADGLAGNHSPFNQALISFFKTNRAKQFAVSELINHVSKITTYNSDQTPVGGILDKSGHLGGEFVFKRVEKSRKAEPDPLQKDLMAWNQAKLTHSLSAYRSYVKDYPEGEFRELAESRIAQFSAISLRDQDMAAWRKAKEQHNIEGYTAYLREFPEGEFKVLAERALMQQRKKVQVIQEETHRREKWEEYVEMTQNLLEEGAYEGAQQCLDEALAISKESEKEELEKLAKQIEERLNQKINISSYPLLEQLGIEMIRVEGGEFDMGSKDGHSNEKPIHKVKLSNFEMGKHEITVKVFRKFIKETDYQTDADKDGGSYVWNGSEWIKKEGINWAYDVSGEKYIESDFDHPVIHISWNDAVRFCNWLSTKDNLEKAYTIDDNEIKMDVNAKGYRLPTEAEWEYAARGGKLSKGYTYAGSNNLNRVAWYESNSGNRTHPVGQKQPNELGIYDMSGNVYEWCYDWYDNKYYKTCADQGTVPDPRGPDSGVRRVLRGGSWLNDASFCRVANRDNYLPDCRFSFFGFRLARAVP